MVREVLVLVRAYWLSRTSYRLQTLMSFGGVVVSVVPLFFIADALQPVMAEPIRGQGERYFGFVMVGMIALYFVHAGVHPLPAAVSGAIRLGTFEALLGTRASLPALLTGMIGADILWTAARATLLLITSWALGAGIHAGGLLPAAAVLLLTLLAYIPFGILSAALVLVFRTTGPVPAGVTQVSALLGGAYFPTHIIPSWIQYFSDVIPLTYGARAIRRVLLEGAPLEAIARDVTILAGMTIGLFAAASLALSMAFRYAKRAGSLAQY